VNTLTTTPNTALIMGAGDSLGSALARRFASEGMNVCITRRNEIRFALRSMRVLTTISR
jgi:NAD(P)-dependent dehydrogenase (short-subunit alcohol dehydrogenase family)